MLVINAGMVFAIIRLSKRTNENMKKYFLDKTGDFFKEINVQPKQEEKQQEVTDDVDVKTKSVYIYNGNVQTNYKNSTFKDEYKSLKNEMNFDKEDVILSVIDTNRESEASEDAYKKSIDSICNSLDFKTVYELGTLSSDKQLEVLNSVFNDSEKELLKEYIDLNSDSAFDVSSFYSYVSEKGRLLDDKFYVKTGNAEENFDGISENVVTVHDDEIVEGIKVVHKNKMYDFSI